MRPAVHRCGGGAAPGGGGAAPGGGGAAPRRWWIRAWRWWICAWRRCGHDLADCVTVGPISAIPATAPVGLTEAEAAARLQARGDAPRQRSSRSYASIIRANTLTIPNGILLVFGVLTITFGSWKDALFLGILFANIGIGSFQEIRSKRALDRLAALVAPQAVVVRDGADTQRAGRPGRRRRSGATGCGRPGRGGRDAGDGRRDRPRRGEPDRGVRAGRAPRGRAGLVGLVRRRGRCHLRGDGRRSR